MTQAKGNIKDKTILKSLPFQNQVVPGNTLSSAIKDKRLVEVPIGGEWKVPLVHSLLEIRAGEFKLEFDDSDGNEVAEDVLLHVCTS